MQARFTCSGTLTLTGIKLSNMSLLSSFVASVYSHHSYRNIVSLRSLIFQNIDLEGGCSGLLSSGPGLVDAQIIRFCEFDALLEDTSVTNGNEGIYGTIISSISPLLLSSLNCRNCSFVECSRLRIITSHPPRQVDLVAQCLNSKSVMVSGCVFTSLTTLDTDMSFETVSFEPTVHDESIQKGMFEKILTVLPPLPLLLFLIPLPCYPMG